MPPIAKRPKKLTQGKIDRARDALEALTECDDLPEWFSVEDRCRIIDAKNVLRVGLAEGRVAS